MIDWPDDLREMIDGSTIWSMVDTSSTVGRYPSSIPTRSAAQSRRSPQWRRAVAISSVFSPVNPDMEDRAAEIVAEMIPDADITRSAEIGRIGLLERENAAILNSCLRPLAAETVTAFRRAISEMGITAPLYLTQNDGTLMSADFAEQYPVLTFASGPTNSMRGAAFLSGLKDAMVVDVGGTTSDVGALDPRLPARGVGGG